MEQNLTRIFTLFGGLALFLYGMDALSHSLETAAGSRLKSLLAAVTGSPVRGVLAGAAVTAVLQSSSAVTVMVLGFVSAGLLTLRQAVPVIFGCNIGTTITAQLLAFRLEDVRGLVLLAGLLLCFACAGRKARAIGRAVFAFGLLFEGIADMGTAMEPLAQSPVFVHWLGRVRQHPWLGLLAGLGMTLTVQSSSATIALLQNFAARPGLDGSSLLGLAGALPVLLGWAVVLVTLLVLFFSTELGCALRATGCNPVMSRAQGVNTGLMKVIGLALSNAVVAMSGGLLCQYQGYTDVNMGRGAVVIGLAAVVIGQAVLGRHGGHMAAQLGGVVLGAVIYYIVYQVIIFAGFDTDLLKMFSAVVVAVFLGVPHVRDQIRTNSRIKKGGSRHAENA